MTTNLWQDKGQGAPVAERAKSLALPWVSLGALSGMMSVAAGAFGAHSLREHLSPERLSIFETAARYQMYHALALLAVGLLAARRPSRGLRLSGWSFFVGTVLFSGSLYLLSLTGIRWIGAITPLGGVGFLLGWAALAQGAFRTTPS